MELDVVAVKKLIADKFRNNQSWFAEELGISLSFLNETLNGKKNPDSNRICVALIIYCEKNNLNFRNYIIFLHKNVQKNEQN